MPDILGQDDIDALLNAAQEPVVEEATPPAQIFSRVRRDREKIEIRPYDFKRPERISKDQMRALEMLHETFARSFGAALSGYLRTIVEVRVANASQMTYAEFTQTLANPTGYALVRCPPLEGTMCLEVSPLVIYPIIDRLLGGNTKDLFIPQRPMTLIETRIIQKIVSRGMAALTEAWQGIRPIQFSLGEIESNPQLVQIVPPNETVVVIAFDVRMSNRAGPMHLCIPYAAIEPLMDGLSAQSWFVTGRRGASDAQDRLTQGVGSARVELGATLATTTISMSDLRELVVGDIISTSHPASDPCVLEVEGRPKFLVELGQHRGSRALRIIRATNPGERVNQS